MSFTSDYLKKKQELTTQQSVPKFTLPTTSGGIMQQVSTVKPVATSTAAGSSNKTGLNNVVSNVSDRIKEINQSISPETRKAYQESKYASSAIDSSSSDTLPNVSRELAFARRTRAGGDTIKKLQEQQNAYLQQQKNNGPDFWDDFWWGVGYNAERIGADLLGAGEKLTDAVGSGFWGAVGGLSSLGGALPNPVSDYANQQAEAFLQNSVSQDWKNSIEERYKPNDLQRSFGDISGAVAAMLPSVGAAIATGGTSAAGQLASGAPKLLSGSNLGKAIMGVQAMGGGAQEAFQEGASLGQALSYGAASGALETAIESLVGGIPGLGKGTASQLLSKVISNPVVQKAVDVAGEGGEEAISTIITPYLKRAIYDSDAKTATLDEIAQSAVMGMVVSGILQGGISLPSALSTRADVTRQATSNLENPEFVQRTTNEAVQSINENLNRQPFTLPSVQTDAQTTVDAQSTSGVQSTPVTPVQQETSVQRSQGVQVPIEDRTWQDAGNRKVNAFQYDHPELRPYYAEAARALKYDLSSAVKGERIPIFDSNSASGKDIIGYTGTKRSVTGPIEQALDNAKLSYAQIDKAIDALIADNGQENYAAAKKLELVLDDMLTNGYTDSDGYDVPPNQEYIAARERANSGVTGSEYSMSEEEWLSLMGQEPDGPAFLPTVDTKPAGLYDGTTQIQPTGGLTYGRGEEGPSARQGALGADVRGETGGTETLDSRISRQGDSSYGGIRQAESGAAKRARIGAWARGHLIENPSAPAQRASARAQQYVQNVFTVDDATLKGRNPNAWAITSGGTIYISDAIPVELADVVGHHEVIHAVKQNGNRNYLDFADTVGSRINLANAQPMALELVVQSRYPGKTLLDLSADELDAVYDELNALVWGYHKADPENARAQFAEVFQDYDAYIRELDAILEQARSGAVGHESSVGAARKGFDPYSAFLGTKSEFFPEGANAARPVDVPTTDAEGNPIRKTASTAMGAKAIPDEVVGDIQNMVMSGDLSYTRMTDQDSIGRAVRTIEADGFQRSMEKFTQSVKKGVVSKDLATLGQQLLVNAANAGDANATAELLSLYAQMETTAGQAVQAASILRKMSPTSQLYAAQKIASNLEQTISKKLKGHEISIDPDLIEEFNQQIDQAGRDVVLDKIYQNIADQVPSTWKDKWNAWRYLAMLGNPRTHIRNIVGNVGFQPVRFMKDRIAAVIESGVSAASGGKLQRTKSFATNPALYAAAWQDYKNVADVLSGNKYDDVQSIINDKRTIFNKGLVTKAAEKVSGKTLPSGVLESARRGNSNLLGVEDMWFKRITYADALAGYLNANGVTADQLRNGTVDSSLMSAARDYAGQEALKATYNDKNVVSDKVVQAAKALGTFGEAILPFKRTPANILVRGAEYSPLGLAKGLTYDLYKVKQGEMTGAQAIDNISAGMTGTGLMLLGGLLAASGIVTGGAGDDDKQAEWNELTGGQTYALNLPGGGSVTLDWLAPEALPFFMGVQAMQSFGEEGLTGDTITSAFASISEPMLEMSMLQSLNDLIDNVSYAASNEKLSGLVGSSLISYLTQAIPTIGGQIERTFEDKRYSTYTNKDSLLPTNIQYALGKASAKIPGWDFQQVPYIDAWGREEETGLLPMRALNNFLNPAYTSSLNVTPVDEEIQRLYNATGVGSVIPSRADKSITVDGEDINLSGDKYVEYAKTKGGTAFDLLSSIIDTSAYKGLSDDEKVKLISDVYEYANSVGKAAVSSYKPEGFSAKVQSTGVDPADYILYRSTADADNNGTVTQSEAAFALLPMKNLSNAEKGKVWQSQNSSWNEKKNPFTGALASAGIDSKTATSILNKYSEVYNMDIDAGEQAAELSKFLDGLNLTSEQRAVVDDTYKFYNMFPATIKAYSIETMSSAAQSKWPKVQAWGMPEEDYLKYYPMVSSGKKADCIKALQDAGMSYSDANTFWSLVKNK